LGATSDRADEVAPEGGGADPGFVGIVVGIVFVGIVVIMC